MVCSERHIPQPDLSASIHVYSQHLTTIGYRPQWDASLGHSLSLSKGQLRLGVAVPFAMPFFLSLSHESLLFWPSFIASPARTPHILSLSCLSDRMAENVVSAFTLAQTRQLSGPGVVPIHVLTTVERRPLLLAVDDTRLTRHISLEVQCCD